MEASNDQRLGPEVRDLFVGIAVLDHYSLTTGAVEPAAARRRGPSASPTARMSPSLRVLCRLGAAWALVGVDPSRARGSRPLGAR